MTYVKELLMTWKCKHGMEVDCPDCKRELRLMADAMFNKAMVYLAMTPDNSTVHARQRVREELEQVVEAYGEQRDLLVGA